MPFSGSSRLYTSPPPALYVQQAAIQIPQCSGGMKPTPTALETQKGRARAQNSKGRTLSVRTLCPPHPPTWPWGGGGELVNHFCVNRRYGRKKGQKILLPESQTGSGWPAGTQTCAPSTSSRIPAPRVPHADTRPTAPLLGVIMSHRLAV